MPPPTTSSPPSTSIFYRVLGTSLGPSFDAHIRELYGVAPTECTPEPTSVASFPDCEYRTFYRTTRASDNESTTKIVYCFDRITSDTLLLAAVHLSGSIALDDQLLSLPAGLQLSWTGRQIVGTLGEPKRKGGASSTATAAAMSLTSGVWLAWDTLGIQVELVATNWESHNASIREIILYQPTK